MKVSDIQEALLIVNGEVDAAKEALSRVPGFSSVRISARFKDDAHKVHSTLHYTLRGVDIVLDSEGNVAIQPQSYGRGSGS